MGKTWIRSDEVVWEELGGEILLVLPRSGARWVLNAAAAAVWKLCDGTREFVEAAAFCDAMATMDLLRPAECAQLAGAPMFFEGMPGFRTLNAGDGARRRPTPRGVSGPI